MKEKLRKYKGITLIALIVTIIILLILAAVAITTITRTKWFDEKSRRSRF